MLLVTNIIKRNFAQLSKYKITLFHTLKCYTIRKKALIKKLAYLFFCYMLEMSIELNCINK